MSGPSQRWGIRKLIGTAAGLVLAAGCSPPAPPFNGEVVEEPAPAPELAGVNWDGQPFQLSEHQGKVAVVTFGYTYCPDVCPFTLAKLKQVSAGLGDRADDLAVVFVSVDPHRDTVEKLSRYVPNFDRRFYGLRIEPTELDALKETWDITIQYGQPKDGPGTDSFYYVDHTGSYFVVDREGQLLLKFPPTASADQMIPDIERLIAS